MRRLLMLGLVGALAACATEQDSGADFIRMMGGSSAADADRIAARLQGKPLGGPENPIRTYMPAGQRAYLARLRCANGQAPAASRIGSTGPGPYGSIVDAYQVTCAGSTPASSELHLDMYHPTHTETAAPPGFTIVP